MEDNCNSTTAMNSYLDETIQFLEVDLRTAILHFY